MRNPKWTFKLKLLLTTVIIGGFIWGQNRSTLWDFEEQYENWSVRGFSSSSTNQYICLMSLTNNSDMVEIYMLLPGKSGGIKFYKQDYGEFLNSVFGIPDWSELFDGGYDELVFETTTGEKKLHVSPVEKHFFKGHLEIDFETRSSNKVIIIQEILNEQFSEIDKAHISALLSNSNVSYSFASFDLVNMVSKERKVYFNTVGSELALKRFESCIKKYEGSKN